MTWATVLEMYRRDFGHYPSGDAKAAADALDPDYAVGVPVSDAWDRLLNYETVPRKSRQPTEYTLRSLGADGLADQDLKRLSCELPSDLVLENGRFLQLCLSDEQVASVYGSRYQAVLAGKDPRGE